MCKNCGGRTAARGEAAQSTPLPTKAVEMVTATVIAPLPYSVLLPMRLTFYNEGRARRLTLTTASAQLAEPVAAWLAERGAVELAPTAAPEPPAAGVATSGAVVTSSNDDSGRQAPPPPPAAPAAARCDQVSAGARNSKVIST